MSVTGKAILILCMACTGVWMALYYGAQMAWRILAGVWREIGKVCEL